MSKTELMGSALSNRTFKTSPVSGQLFPQSKEFTSHDEDSSSVKLSKRMKQLLALIDQGLSNVEISKKLGVSEHTVKVHCWRLFQRIGVKSRGQASAWWRNHQPGNPQSFLSLSDLLLLKEAFRAACKYIDKKQSRKEFDFYRDQVLKIEGRDA